jgi:cytochrome c-type biogenesis protein CcmH/NrfF
MFFIQLGVISMMVACWVTPLIPEVGNLALWFLPFMALGLMAQLLFAWIDTRSARYRGY